MVKRIVKSKKNSDEIPEKTNCPKHEAIQENPSAENEAITQASKGVPSVAVKEEAPSIPEEIEYKKYFRFVPGSEKFCIPRLSQLKGMTQFVLRVHKMQIFGDGQWNVCIPVPRDITTFVKTGIRIDSPVFTEGSFFNIHGCPERLLKVGIWVDPTPVFVDNELVLALYSSEQNFRLAQGMDLACINILTVN